MPPGIPLSLTFQPRVPFLDEANIRSSPPFPLFSFPPLLSSLSRPCSPLSPSSSLSPSPSLFSFRHQGMISMLDVAVHILRSRDMPVALHASVVELIGNSAEGMSLWATARMTP